MAYGVTAFDSSLRCERRLVRVDGIEPTQPAWKAGVLPLNYTRFKKERLKSIAGRTGQVLFLLGQRNGIEENGLNDPSGIPKIASTEVIQSSESSAKAVQKPAKIGRFISSCETSK